MARSLTLLQRLSHVRAATDGHSYPLASPEAGPPNETLHQTLRHTLRCSLGGQIWKVSIHRNGSARPTALPEQASQCAPCASMRSSDSLRPDEAPEAGGNMGLTI